MNNKLFLALASIFLVTLISSFASAYNYDYDANRYGSFQKYGPSYNYEKTSEKVYTTYDSYGRGYTTIVSKRDTFNQENDNYYMNDRYYNVDDNYHYHPMVPHSYYECDYRDVNCGGYSAWRYNQPYDYRDYPMNDKYGEPYYYQPRYNSFSNSYNWRY